MMNYTDQLTYEHLFALLTVFSSRNKDMDKLEKTYYSRNQYFMDDFIPLMIHLMNY